MTPRTWCCLAILATLLVAAAVLRLFIWDRGLDSPAFVLNGLAQLLGLHDPGDEAWFIRFRLRMIASAVIIGAALSASGLLLQGLLRNPLAAPSILGLTSGAGVGVVLAMVIAWTTTGAISATTAGDATAAILGAIAALLLVYTLGQRRAVIEPVTLLLSGVIVSIMCGALMVALYQFLPDQGLAVAMRWMMGSITQDITLIRQGSAAAVLLLCLALAFRLTPALDIATLGDEEAHSLGISLPRLRLLIFILAGAMTGITILLAGPVGFVGLICPHLARRLVGPAHRPTLIAALLLGALLILLAEIASTLTASFTPAGQVPVGVLMALIGGPVFILILRRGVTSLHRGDTP